MSKKRVLLINPPWISKDESIWNGVRSAMPPLGLLSIASYLESFGFHPKFIDIHVEKISGDEVFDQIKEFNPDIVGLTCMTATANAAHAIADISKKAAPNCMVVFGGVHAEALPDETLSHLKVDLVVRGDGEETFLEICQGETPIKKMAGISYRTGNQIIHNPARAVETNLSKFPMPAYHLAPMDKYYPAIGAYKRLPAINMLMTRGCPGKCTFCNSANTVLRTREASQVVEEIKFLRDNYGIREIQFYDDTFTVMKKNVMEFCKLMEKAKLNISWAAFVRADCFSERMARAMKKAGCHQILIGVESGDDNVLKLLGKPIDRERTKKAINIARKAGLTTRAAFIFGNRGETLETMQKTLDFSMELDPDICQYSVCTPYPGTQLYQWVKENRYLVSEEWSEYELSTFLMKLPTLKTEDLHRFYKYAHKAFYSRPKIMWRQLLRSSRPSHIVDLIHAFFFIILRIKVGRRSEARKDWINHKKNNFFDIKLKNDIAPMLTYISRQEGQIPKSGLHTKFTLNQNQQKNNIAKLMINS